jgi:hypothetical protein
MVNYTIVLDINGEDHEVKMTDIAKAICEQYSDNYTDVFTIMIKTMLSWADGENHGEEYLQMLIPLFKETVNQLPVETTKCEDYVLKAAYSILKDQKSNCNW